MSSPYRSPSHQHEQIPTNARPGVWKWYVLYCVAMAIVYLLCLAFGIFLATNADMLAAEDPSIDAVAIQIQGVLFTVLGGLLFFVFAAGPFVPRSKAGWIYGFVPICIGLTSLCCLPASLPLLLAWLKPEVKNYFNA